MALNFSIPAAPNEWTGLRPMTAALAALPGFVGAWSAAKIPNGLVWSWPSLVGGNALTQTTNGRAPTADGGVLRFAGMQSLFLADILTVGQPLMIGLRFRSTSPATDIQNFLGRATTTVGIYRSNSKQIIVGTQSFPAPDPTLWQTLILTRSTTQDVAELGGETKTVARTGGWDAAHFRVGHHLATPSSGGLIGEISHVVAMAGVPSAAEQGLLRRFLGG